MGRLQTARLENFIRRWGSIKGGGSVLSETLGDVFPVLDLENLTPENQLTAGWTLFWARINVLGAVAKLGAASLINPVNSGSIVVCEKIIVNASGADAYLLSVNDTLLTQTLNTSPRDSRVGTDFIGNAVLGASTDTTSPTHSVVIRAQAGIDREFELPNGLAVLSPGFQLQVTASTTNTQMFHSFFGRVRLAESSELSF